MKPKHQARVAARRLSQALRPAAHQPPRRHEPVVPGERMTADNVDARAVQAALAEIKAQTFRTKELADLPSMRQAHALWASEHSLGYYPRVGSYLSLHGDELGIRRISADGARNAVWKKTTSR
jgi:hypothetical protein